MTPLPRIMVAPNGARLTRKDHPAVPVTIAQIVETAQECALSGADGLHAHVRDEGQQHVLDAGLYKELIAEMAQSLPGFYTQITTEALGRYTTAEQMELVRDVQPKAVSIALREIMADATDADMHRFYHECVDAGIGVQHILYDTEDVMHLARLVRNDVVPQADLKGLLVLGRYTTGQLAHPDNLMTPVSMMNRELPEIDWAVCAFGRWETDCLLAAHGMGAKMRIGFENNRLNKDMTCAASNAERVRELVDYLTSSPEGDANYRVA